MFPDRLRALRKGRHLTLNQLANVLNHHFNEKGHRNTSAQIENWERGIRIPPYTEIMKLAQLFHVSMDYLSGRSYNNSVDLANYLISDSDLQFNGNHLDPYDRNQIYALIQGYISGKKQRPVRPVVSSNHKQLNLNFKNKE